MMFPSPSGRATSPQNRIPVGEFGNKFRKAREKKALSLDDVSHVTKIGSRMLQAIEDERFDLLPGGVFNKGFIRAYAQHVGLNDEDAINDYLACLRKTQIDALEGSQLERPGQPRAAARQKPGSDKPGLDKQVPAKPGSSKPDSSSPGKPNPSKAAPGKPAFDKQIPDQSEKSAAKSPASAQLEELPELQLPRAEHVRPRRRDFELNSGVEIPWRILAVSALVIVLGIILWTRRSHRPHIAAAASAPAHTTQSAPPPSIPASGNPSSPLLRSASASVTHPSSALAPASARPPAAAADHAAVKAVDDNISANPNAATAKSPSNPPPTQPSTAPLTLVIRATENSWISILADGQPVSHETLIAPARISVRATREIIVKVGNAAGVTFLWNGHEIPASGAEAEVKTYVFDSTGMQIAPAPPPPAQ